MNRELKILRISTVALSLDVLLKGQLKYLNQYYEVIAVSGKDHHLEEVAKRERVNTIDVPFSRPISLIQDIKSLIHVYKVIKKERPTIVHSITPKAGLLSMVAAKIAGVPIRIHTFTGLVFPYKKGIFQKILIAMDKVLCACATKIIPEGLGVKKDLEQYKITNKPMDIIANGNVNGVDLAYFDPTIEYAIQRKDVGIETTDFVYVFVGRLVNDKGIHELVSAFCNIQQKHPHAKLLLVGPFEQELDPLRQETIDQIEQNKSIIAVGYQNDVRPFFKMANCLVFPSHREGFPNVVLQAGAMGLPSVVTNISGSNEIIIHGENGLIGTVKEEHELQNNMSILLEDEVLNSILSQNARNYIAAKYSQELVWKSLHKVYEEQLSYV